MAGAKKPHHGSGGQPRFWYERGTDNKLTHIFYVDDGKRSWRWAVRAGDNYRYLDAKERELR